MAEKEITAEEYKEKWQKMNLMERRRVDKSPDLYIDRDVWVNSPRGDSGNFLSWHCAWYNAFQEWKKDYHVVELPQDVDQAIAQCTDSREQDFIFEQYEKQMFLAWLSMPAERGKKIQMVDIEKERKKNEKEIERQLHEYRRYDLDNRKNPDPSPWKKYLTNDEKRGDEEKSSHRKQEIQKPDKNNGFHTRFKQVDENTIQETNESGATRFFRKNKEGKWEAEGVEGKTTLVKLGKSLFNVQTVYPNGSKETILYSSAKQIREFFVQDAKGKSHLMERMDEDINDVRHRQIFDLDGNLIEERISENWALKRLVRNGKVLIDSTKPGEINITNAIKKQKGNNR